MSDTDFFADLDRLRCGLANSGTSTKITANEKPVPRRVRGEFLKGPVPLAWLGAAAKLPGQAPLAVGLAVWFEAGRRRSTEITLTTAVLMRFGVDRKAKYRGLMALEDAGLIRVERVPRRNPVVTIIEANNTSPQIEARDVTGMSQKAEAHQQPVQERNKT